MKVSKNWLKELVELNISGDELVHLLPLRTIGIKETTDDFIELDMKGYNRADLLSMRGVAREVAAITNSAATFNESDEDNYVWWESFDEDNQEGVLKKDLSELNVTIENKNLVPIYCLAKVERLEVGKSSPGVIKKLNDSGMRSIDSVTDITNLIMLEYGQPMHAFDAFKVKDEKIIVRKAYKGEKLITLDGKEPQLLETDILITDPEKPLGLAGIMGGKNSEVSESTTTILLEAAIFDPITIRKTVTRLGLSSEASKRFIHELTRKNILEALNKAISMYQKLGGKLTGLYLDNLKNQNLSHDPIIDIPLNLDKVNSLTGISIPGEQVQSYLTRLGCQFISQKKIGDKTSWIVRRPYYRLDLVIEEDLIEEVARMYGYEKIPAQPLTSQPSQKIDQSLFELIAKIKQKLAEAGLTEIQTYSFFSTNVLNNFTWDKTHLVKIANPMSAETEYMREDIWPNLVEVAVKNLKRNFSDLAIFEIGKVYNPKLDDRPEESYRLSISLSNETNNPVLELYSIFQKLNLDLKQNMETGSAEQAGYEQKYFHPARFRLLNKDRRSIGGIAEVHPRYLQKFGIEDKRVAVLELEISFLVDTIKLQ